MNQPHAQNGLFLPCNRTGPMPLLVAFHGGGHDGESQLNLWKPLASGERFIVLAPTSADSRWNASEDATNVQAQVKEITAGPLVDKSRIYFFGHSLGAVPALLLAFAHRNIVAATALHSPSWGSGVYDLNDQPQGRPLPLGIWVGDAHCDSNYDIGTALEGRYKEDRNFSVQLEVLPQHKHEDIYIRPSLTSEIWDFLKQHECRRGILIS
jgi:poly(3-hydroxybutyrate) depolymerase